MGKKRNQKGGSKKRAARARRKRPDPMSYGQQVGSVIGRALGGAAQSLFRHVTGMGAYKVNRNSLLPGNDPPQFEGSEATRIRHREYLGDITGSIAFTTQTYPLNPGIATSFPWLANIAQGFEEYQFLGVIFEFKSTSAVALNSTNTALGTVIMATEYNAQKPAFISKLQMENYEYASSAAPSVDQMHPVECDPKLTPFPKLFVRGPTATIGDIKTYDLGFFQLATVGMQAAAVIGELWVTYDVALYKPTMVSPGGVLFAEADHWRATTGISNTAWFGTSGGLNANGLGGAFIVSSPGGKYFLTSDTVPGDTYQMTILIYGASTSWTNPSFTLSSGLTAFQSPITASGQWMTNSTGTCQVCEIMFVVNTNHAAGAVEIVSLTSGTGTCVTSPTECDVFVNFLGNNFA